MGGEFEFRFNTQILVKLLLTKIVIQHFQEPEGQQAFMNRVDGRLKQIETQVNKIDEVKSSLVNITRKVSSLEITVKELKEKNIDIHLCNNFI
jgi:hypothetical protein